jgi:uncharacterized protein YjeT (DUF2065 family)
MIWSDLPGAFALYLVLEGILPFASPQAMRRVIRASVRTNTYALAHAPAYVFGASSACRRA